MASLVSRVRGRGNCLQNANPMHHLSFVTCPFAYSITITSIRIHLNKPITCPLQTYEQRRKFRPCKRQKGCHNFRIAVAQANDRSP